MHYVVAIPFRKRHDELAVLLPHLKQWLPTQQYISSWEIIVVEQMDKLFNLGWCINVGFAMGRRRNGDRGWRYIFQPADALPQPAPMRQQGTPYFQIVDIPEDAWDYDDVRFADYSCADMTAVLLQPQYWESSAHSRGWAHFGRYYRGLAFDAAAYIAINGHSNRYFGYGYEDDDLLARLEASPVVTTERRPMTFNEFPVRGYRDMSPDSTKLRDLYLAWAERAATDGLTDLTFYATVKSADAQVTWIQAWHGTE